MSTNVDISGEGGVQHGPQVGRVLVLQTHVERTKKEKHTPTKKEELTGRYVKPDRARTLSSSKLCEFFARGGGGVSFAWRIGWGI